MASFLDLPPEIRLQVYSHLKGSKYLSSVKRDDAILSRYISDTAILQANRLIYNEAAPVLTSNGMIYEISLVALPGSLYHYPGSLYRFMRGVLDGISALKADKYLSYGQKYMIVISTNIHGESFTATVSDAAYFERFLSMDMMDWLRGLDWLYGTLAGDVTSAMRQYVVGETISGKDFVEGLYQYLSKSDVADTQPPC